jgi:hypothetical protein
MSDFRAPLMNFGIPEMHFRLRNFRAGCSRRRHERQWSRSRHHHQSSQSSTASSTSFSSSSSFSGLKYSRVQCQHPINLRTPRNRLPQNRDDLCLSHVLLRHVASSLRRQRSLLTRSTIVSTPWRRRFGGDLCQFRTPAGM